MKNKAKFTVRVSNVAEISHIFEELAYSVKLYGRKATKTITLGNRQMLITARACVLPNQSINGRSQGIQQLVDIGVRGGQAKGTGTLVKTQPIFRKAPK